MAGESHDRKESGVWGRINPVPETKQAVWCYMLQGGELLGEMATGDRLAGTQAIPQSWKDKAKGDLWLAVRQWPRVA